MNSWLRNWSVSFWGTSLCLATIIASTSISASAQTTVRIGEVNVLNGIDNGNSGVLIAQSASLSRAARVTSLSLYVPRAVGSLYLGLYDASGPNRGPGKLLATTGSFTAVKGWNTRNVVSQVNLAAGNYWLAYLPSSSTLRTVFNTNGPARGVFYTYGYKAMPSTFSRTPSQTNYHWSFYASLNVSSTPTPTPTPTPNPTPSPTPVADTSAPSVPANLQASVVSTSQINLSFGASTDNVGVSGYLIERCQGTSCSNFAQITSQSALSFSNTGLAANTSYSYRVRARDAAGNMSAYSAVATAVTQTEVTSGFVLGQRPFSATSSWNKPISASASYAKMNWPASTGYNYSVAWDAYSPSIIVSKPTDPVVSVSIPANWGWPAQILQIRMPAGVTGAVGTDGELLVIDGDQVHNFWQFKRNSSNAATASAYGRANILTGSGWGSKSPFLSAGIVATGSSQMAGLLVQAETDAGEIQHALQITMDFVLQKPGFTGEAIAGDGGSSTGIAVEGERFAIPKTAVMPSGLSPLGQKVFRAMQNYGVYNIDVSGGVTNLRAQANAYDDATMTALWKDLLKITPMLHKVTNY